LVIYIEIYRKLLIHSLPRWNPNFDWRI